MLAILCPGQGAQKPGFLAPWLELSGFAATIDWLGTVTGIDLRAHGTTSDADTIRDTSIAQPLLVAAGIGVWRELVGSQEGPAADVIAGHSVGEITAAYAAGVFSAESAMVFVRERGNAMAAAAALTPTSMAGVIGGDPQEVSQRFEECGITGANYNGGGQVVAAGSVEGLAAFKDNPPAKSRVIPLSVAGAFHTEYMAPGQEQLAKRAAGVPAADPNTTLLTNHDGRPVTSGTQYRELLINQITRPVRWDACTQTMIDAGVTGIIELAPAGTLTGLARRSMRGVPSVALNTPEDLDAAQALVKETRS